MGVYILLCMSTIELNGIAVWIYIGWEFLERHLCNTYYRYWLHFACRELLAVGYVEILILHHSVCVLCLFLESKCQHGRAYIGQCLIRVYTQAALNNVFK